MSLHQQLARKLCNYNDEQSIGTWFRRRRAKPLIAMLQQCHQRYGYVDVIDIGGRESYWAILPEHLFAELKLSITLVNDDDELSEAHRYNPSLDRHFIHVRADGCHLSHFSDNSFHVVHCNSVIEHVGEWQHMQALAGEVRRLAPCHYVQTPSFWFPIEPHFLAPFYHWLPESIRVALLMRLSLGHMQRQHTVEEAINVVQSVHLLDQPMMQALFPDSDLLKEKCLFLTKSFIATQIRFK